MTDQPVGQKKDRSSSTGRAYHPRTPRTISPAKPVAQPQNPLSAAILEEARRSGLLEGGKTAHVSFRAPHALIEAARRETGITSASELGTLALAILAQPDPVAAFMKRTRGRLGKDHKLDY